METVAMETATVAVNVCGGWSATMQATEEIQAKCDQFKHVIEAAENKTFKVFKAVAHRYQVVNGINYIVKIFVGQDLFFHVMFVEELRANGGLSLTSVIRKKDEDPLVPV
ncbi:stefin-C-like isoform X2 [Takifugu rubripes]|uniref:stefin-C-like isoform X2 n=1 Tax=Takifugu rubripes TaxID=31033 RepID=UPI0005D1C3F1|nr:stefin-C-like isoform X2 [Takifugu rubripes]|eukprot:XP_011619349.1 PREDICTED: stefin-C-like [Takifugu rubripes]